MHIPVRRQFTNTYLKCHTRRQRRIEMSTNRDKCCVDSSTSTNRDVYQFGYLRIDMLTKRFGAFYKRTAYDVIIIFQGRHVPPRLLTWPVWTNYIGRSSLYDSSLLSFHCVSILTPHQQPPLYVNTQQWKTCAILCAIRRFFCLSRRSGPSFVWKKERGGGTIGSVGGIRSSAAVPNCMS